MSIIVVKNNIKTEGTIKMGTKPVIKIQQEVTTNHRNNVLKSFKLPATKIRKLKRLPSTNTIQQVNQKADFEFEKIIMPKIEEAIHFINTRTNVNKSPSLSIIEQPQNSKSQKIFLIKNSSTNDDWIRFYVRFKNGFAEGNYSFFYYTFEDNFTTHYNLGKVYWSKTIC